MSVFSIPTKKIFAIAIALKTLSAIASLLVTSSQGVGFYLSALVIPLITMSLYIYLGWNRKDRSLSDEKFADSCYYLGFLFTIISIVVSLIDMGVKREQLQFDDITLRFGVAMASTALGLAVRVYLVNFKVELNDAVVAAEDEIIRSAGQFADRLQSASEAYKRFELSINTSTNNVVEHVGQRIEKMSEDHARRLEENYQFSVERLNQFSLQAFKKLEEASEKLASATNSAADATRTVMRAFESELKTYAENLRERIDSSTLPSDFFAKQLEPSVNGLITKSNEFAKVIASSSEEIRQAAGNISDGLSAMNRRATSAAKALETLERSSSYSQSLVEKVAQLIEMVQRYDQGTTAERETLATLGKMHLASLQIKEQVESLPNVLNAIKVSLEEISITGIESREDSVNFRADFERTSVILDRLDQTLSSISSSLVSAKDEGILITQRQAKVVELLEEIRSVALLTRNQTTSPDEPSQ